MSATELERLARIEEALKHISEKLDTMLGRQTTSEDVLDKLKEQLFDIRATMKLHRIFIAIGVAGAFAGAGTLSRLFGLL